MRPAHTSAGLPRLALLALVLASLPAWGAPVTAELDRSSAVEGETVTLVLQTNDPQQSLDTDLAVLDKDFNVTDQRSETQMSIVSGSQTAVVRLLVTLEPKHTGTLTIPALSFPGGASTQPLQLEVSAAPPLAPGELPPVFIETELDPQEGPYYVHAQLSLKVRIFYQQNLTEAAINPPSPEQASVRLLDEVPYQADRNGKQYRVLERRYAIFPERSGELVIPPMQLTGRLIERPSDRFWQPSVRGRRISVKSDPLTLDISPKPPEYKGEFWLPARRIDLSQQISDNDELRVGEPVTRTVILDAVGLEENMLEEPKWPKLEHARIYPDQPQGISRDDGQWVLGHREFRYAVVPEQAGELVLPEIRLHWWDTTANRERVAILPEHHVQVLPSAAVPAETAPAAAATAASGSGPSVLPGGSAELNRWRLITLVFALLWLATLVLYLRSGSGWPRRAPRRAAQPDTEAAVLAALKRACQAADASEARKWLRRWLREFGPQRARGSLMAFATDHASADLARELRQFDASRFSPRAGSGWDGKAMWRAFEDWRKTTPAQPGNGDKQDFDLYAQAR